MSKCPNCKREVSKPEKTWTYSRFEVKGYHCNNCGTNFREYFKAGKHSFTLKYKKGKNKHYIRA